MATSDSFEIWNSLFLDKSHYAFCFWCYFIIEQGTPPAWTPEAYHSRCTYVGVGDPSQLTVPSRPDQTQPREAGRVTWIGYLIPLIRPGQQVPPHPQISPGQKVTSTKDLDRTCLDRWYPSDRTSIGPAQTGSGQEVRAPPVDGETDRYKNITFPHPSGARGKNCEHCCVLYYVTAIAENGLVLSTWRDRNGWAPSPCCHHPDGTCTPARLWLAGWRSASTGTCTCVCNLRDRETFSMWIHFDVPWHHHGLLIRQIEKN